MAQTLQLVWGGRDPALRSPTHPGRAGAAGAGRAPAAPHRRRAGRRLPLPAPGRAPAADGGRPADPFAAGNAGRPGGFALFMGFADAAAFADRAVAPHDAGADALPGGVRRRPPVPTRRRRRTCWISAAPAMRRRRPPRRCAAMGYADTGHVVEAVRALAGRPGAGAALAAGARADAHGAAAAAGGARPPGAARRRLRPLRRVPRPAAGRRAAAVAVPAQPGAAGPDRQRARRGPSLADYLARTPEALEGLLAPAKTGDLGRGRCAAGWPTRAAWRRRSASSARPFAPRISPSRSRPWKGGIDADAAGEARSALADAALVALLPRVLDDFAGALRPGARRRRWRWCCWARPAGGR